MASKHLTLEQQNFVRLSLAGVDEARVVLGYVLHSQILPKDIVNKIQANAILSSGPQKLKPEQKKLCCIPGPGVPDYKTFDITLLYKLIRNLCSSLQPSQGWGKEPRPTENNIGDDIERLRFFRNEMIGHVNSSSVPGYVFQSKWNELENIFKRIQGFLTTQGNPINLVERLESIKSTDFGWQDYDKCQIHLKLECMGLTDAPKLTLEDGERKTCGESACFVVKFGDGEMSNNWPITWQRIKGNITEQLDTGTEKYKGSSSQQLVIPKVSKEDEGEYRATVSREEKGTHIQIPSNTIYLTVTGDLPNLKMNLAVSDKNNIIICYIISTNDESSAVNRVVWSKDGEPLDENADKYSGGSLRHTYLTIHSPTSTDIGQYSCEVFNAVGSVKKTINLDFPSASINDKLTAVVGDSVTITATIRSSPTLLSAKWQKSSDGTIDHFTDVDINDPRYFGSTADREDPKLCIPKTTREDGIFYRLVVSNGLGQCESNTAFLKLVGDVPSVFVNHETHVSEQSIKLVCIISLYQQSPEVSRVLWTKDGKEIDILGSGGKYAGGNIADPSLTINAVNSNDEGKYQCCASNSVGSMWSENILLGPPTIELGSPNVDDTHGTVTYIATIKSIPLAMKAEWKVKEDLTGNYKTIDISDPLYRGSTVSMPHPKLVHGYRTDHLKSYQLEVFNSIGSSKRNIEDVTVNSSHSKVKQDKVESVVDMLEEQQREIEKIEQNENKADESQESDDKKENVPDEVKKQIQKQGIDFLSEGMSSEHERYHSGIAQILKVPVELLKMSKEDIKTFIRNYKEGSTKVYCGRGMVVGCFGAGKTTLVKKLKGEDVSSPSASTRGLEVHTNIFIVDETGLTVNKGQKSGQRLCINLESLESEVVKPSSIAELPNPKTVAEIPKTTIPQVLTDTRPAESMRELDVHAHISTGNGDKIGLRGNKDQKNGQRLQMHSESMGSGVVKTSSGESELNLPSPKMETGSTSGQSDEAGKGPVRHSVIIEQITENDVDEAEANQQVQRRDEDTVLSNVSDKSVKTISLLDFAGQGAYYACHHIFLSPRTFYMLVTDMSKILSIPPTEAAHTRGLMYSGWTHQDYINHWLGSIHTYSSETAPVILVLSHSEGKDKEEENTYFTDVKIGVTKVLQTHLKPKRTFAVEKDSDKNMQEIKTCMLSIVKNQSHWGESIPTSWVHLEACLMKIKKQQKVVKKKDLWEILPSQIKKGIPSEEDMRTALKLFNDIGVILYTSSSESIILDVQWFVDAFKVIITDEDHAKHDIENHFSEWIEFSKNGILPKDLVKEIWFGSESFTKYTEDLLLHMIRLGMIAKIGKGPRYYVPCMNKQKYDKDVLRNCACSSTICFMFEYLPLVIFHRLIATCMTKDGWEIWNGNNGQTSECVFHTAALLEDKDDLKMLIGITEKKKNLFHKKNTHPYSIEIQGFLFKDQQMPKQFPPRKLERIRKHLKDLTSCFEANRSMTFRIGYRCSIAPFSDTPDSHIILESAKECASCRKTEGIDNLKSFWMADATSENDTTESAGKKHILSDSGLVDVATRLGAEWSLVAVSLGLKQAEIDQIKLDNPYNTHTQIYTALQKWRDRQGDQTDDTLLKQLFTALETCDHADLLEEMREKYNISEPYVPDDEKENVPDEELHELDDKKENVPPEEQHEPDDKKENVPDEESHEPDDKKENVPDAGQMERPLLDEARFTADICTGYIILYSVVCLSDDRVWTCGGNKTMRLLTIQGQRLSSVRTKSGNQPGDITVTGEGDLVYTDGIESTINVVSNNQPRTVVTLQGWRPLRVCCTAGHQLLVTMVSDDGQYKVVRYSGSTATQTIQFDDQGRPLYSSAGRISENRNLDICVADPRANAVVVVNQSGKLRFRYTGHPSNTGKSFSPAGITTDSQSHILIADFGTNGRIHILDQDGQFLRYIHNLDGPYGLCVDSRDNLFVAEYGTAKVKRIQYLESQR